MNFASGLAANTFACNWLGIQTDRKRASCAKGAERRPSLLRPFWCTQGTRCATPVRRRVFAPLAILECSELRRFAGVDRRRHRLALEARRTRSRVPARRDALPSRALERGRKASCACRFG